MSTRKIKNLLYEQVAKIGKAVSSPKRLEMLELLSQGEKTVERLAADAAIGIKLASAHLKVLKEARLVEVRRDGRFISYRLTGRDVSDLWVNLRAVAEEHLVELRLALERIFAAPERLSGETRMGLLERARQGEVIVIDVRPQAEYAVGHLPFARSMPLAEVKNVFSNCRRIKKWWRTAAVRSACFPMRQSSGCARAVFVLERYRMELPNGRRAECRWKR